MYVCMKCDLFRLADRTPNGLVVHCADALASFYLCLSISFQSHPKVTDKLKELIERWNEEFKNDSQLK